MSTTAFDKALKRTLGHEGGVSDHPSDRGGFTNRGITQHLYNIWRTTTGQSTRPVNQITDREIVQIALEEFWLPCKCAELPEAIALAVFDMAFNSSPPAAIRCLQRALGVTVDGRIGPKTIAAANAAGLSLVLDFLKKRAAYIQDVIYNDSRQLDMLEGWIIRLLEQAWEPS